MLLMRNGTLLLAALCLAACSSGNPRYNGDKAHHRPTGFVNSDPTANIGNIPLHEVLLRRLHGDAASPPLVGVRFSGSHILVFDSLGRLLVLSRKTGETVRRLRLT